MTLNSFYRNDHDKDGFLLKEMPDVWKSEFEALAEISAERPTTANQTADRIAAVIEALKNL